MINEEHFVKGGWEKPVNKDCEKFIVIAFCKMITKSKEVVQQYFSRVGISAYEREKNNNIVGELKRVKEKSACFVLKNTLKNLIGKRMGLRGYKGRWRITDIETLQE